MDDYERLSKYWDLNPQEESKLREFPIKEILSIQLQLEQVLKKESIPDYIRRKIPVCENKTILELILEGNGLEVIKAFEAIEKLYHVLRYQG